MMRILLAMVAAVFLVNASIGNAQSRRVSGDVVALDGAKLTVKTNRGGEVTVMLADATRINLRIPASVAQITPGAFVGAMSVPQADGTLRVTAIQVFPESARRTGEGHRPMDTDPGNTMTNATVANVAALGTPTMTNATVGSVAGAANARRVTVTYKGGERVLVIPDNANVFTSANGDRSMLVPGAHVSVIARTNADGALAAVRISVGKDGYVPPL